MSPLILFSTYLGALMVISGSKKLETLNHIKGRIIDSRYIKHVRITKYKTYNEIVLVLTVEGANDEFGFTESHKNFETLSSMRKRDRVAEIYYDEAGKRIEQNVTLHIFDLAINNNKIIDIKDVIKRKRTGAFICLSLSAVFLILTFLGIRQLERTGTI